jgi:polysaccharide chain length determinant protein (PEP-CTERM system associated)
MADETIRKSSPTDLVRGIWLRRRWLALVVFAAPATAVVGLATFLPNVYESTARVLVEHQQVPEAFVKTTVTSELENRLRTISQEALSRSRLLELIDRFGLYADRKGRVPQEELVEQMRRDIKPLEFEFGDVLGRGVRPVTVAFTVSFQGRDPETVALVTNALASFYIEENLKVRERMATGTAQFLRVQLDETKRRLDEQERRVSEFKRKYIGELPQQMTANLQLLERLATQLQINNSSLARASERREALLKQISEGDAATPAGVPDAVITRLAKLREELTSLRTRYTENYPDVRRARSEIALLEKQLTEGKPDGDTALTINPTVIRLRQQLAELDAEVRALRTEEKSLRGTMATLQHRVENAPRREQEFQEIDRDYETTKELYKSLLRRHEEAQLSESMEQSQKGEQFRVVDPAVASHEPAAPKRPRLILMGLALSLGLAAAAVLLAEQLDTSFHAIEDLRAASPVPVLLALPRLVTERDLGRRRQRARIALAAGTLGLLVIFGASYVAVKPDRAPAVARRAS